MSALYGSMSDSLCVLPPIQVLRVPMEDHEREKFIRCARELVGRKYDVVR